MTFKVDKAWCPVCGDEVDVSSDGFILDHRKLKRGWGRDEDGIKRPVDIYFDCTGQGAFVEPAK